MMKMYLGVVQDTPVFVRVAFVISTCNQYHGEKERTKEHVTKSSQGQIISALREKELGESLENAGK